MRTRSTGGKAKRFAEMGRPRGFGGIVSGPKGETDVQEQAEGSVRYSVWIDLATGKPSHAHSMEQQPGG